MKIFFKIKKENPCSIVTNLNILNKEKLQVHQKKVLLERWLKLFKLIICMRLGWFFIFLFFYKKKFSLKYDIVTNNKKSFLLTFSTSIIFHKAPLFCLMFISTFSLSNPIIFHIYFNFRNYRKFVYKNFSDFDICTQINNKNWLTGQEIAIYFRSESFIFLFKATLHFSLYMSANTITEVTWIYKWISIFFFLFKQTYLSRGWFFLRLILR